MKTGTPGFVGGRLSEARIARGLTAISLAEMIGVTPQSISQYEKNRQSPRPEIMDIIAERLNVPRSYFLRKIAAQDAAPIFWRSNASALKAARDRAEIRLIWLREIMNYLQEFMDFPALGLPKLALPDDFKEINSGFLENAAAAVRDYWGVGQGPMPDLLLEMENNGIIVSRIHIGAEKLDAFSQWSLTDNTGYVVLGRDKASAVRQRFDAAHELGHILLHRKVDKKRLNTARDFQILEYQAHYFASALLLPEAQFVADLISPSLDSFLALKDRWKVSIAAMIVRCNRLELVDEEQTKRLWMNYNRRRWRGSEPLDDRIEEECPRLLRRGIEMLLSEKVKSRSQLLSDLPLSAQDIEELCGLDLGTLSGPRLDAKAQPTLRVVGGREAHPSGGGNVIALADSRTRA